MALISCMHCGQPTDVRACSCPHCDAQLKRCGLGLHRAAGAALLGLVVAGCDGAPIDNPEPAYGIAFIDDDGDGFEQGEDCDDSDPEVYPGADETPGDGVDSNCDGEDDT